MLDADLSQNPYDVLLLPPDSSPQQVHAQYRRLAKQFHPDRNPHRREWAEQRLRVLNAAYSALARTSALLPAAAQDAVPAVPAPTAAAGAGAKTRPGPARRALRYVAVVSLVCGVSVAYSNWSQTLQSGPLPPLASPASTSAASGSNDASAPPAPGINGASASAPPGTRTVFAVRGSGADDASTYQGPAANDASLNQGTGAAGASPPAAPVAADNSAPAAPVAADNPAPAPPISSAAPVPGALPARAGHASAAAGGVPGAPVRPLPAEAGQDALALLYAQENVGVNEAEAQAARVVSHVDEQEGHAPQSRRPQRAEQLAADSLELARLQHFIRDGLSDLRVPASADLHHAQVADLQLALFQMQKQRRLVNADLASFPVK